MTVKLLSPRPHLYGVGYPRQPSPLRQHYGAFMGNFTSVDLRSAWLHIRQNGGRQGKNSCKHPGHSVCTHFMFELSHLRWVRQGVFMRKSCSAFQGHSTHRGETTRPFPLPPPPPRIVSPTRDGRLDRFKK